MRQVWIENSIVRDDDDGKCMHVAHNSLDPPLDSGFILTLASIPTACTGLVNSAVGLAILRLCIGMAGGTFVMCQYWTSRMFTKSVVGTANALVGGWGNLGGGTWSVQ